jgi:hypothetical protein
VLKTTVATIAMLATVLGAAYGCFLFLTIVEGASTTSAILGTVFGFPLFPIPLIWLGVVTGIWWPALLTASGIAAGLAVIAKSVRKPE